MDREIIKEIINQLEKLSNKYSDDNVRLAFYILHRYGIFEFNNYITSEELTKINEELKKKDTMFDEDFNYQVDMILNENR